MAGTIFGLIFGCPLEDDELMKNCVFNEIWKLEPKNRLNLVRNLNSEEIIELEKFHNFLKCKNHNHKHVSDRIKTIIDSLL